MNKLFEEAKKLNIDLNDTQLEQFKKYMDFLLEYNTHTNLTSIIEPEDIMIKHFLDSIILTNYFQIPTNAKVIDVGTGAGFPGVPLKILKKDINLTLVDSLNKRIVFLNELMDKINSESEIIHSRAEELSKKTQYREKFDLGVSRAVASLNVLCEYILPYVKKGGYFIALKGGNIENELESSQEAIKILGGKIQSIESLELPEGKGSRSIIIIQKTSLTPAKYPRHNSQISKKPL